MKVPLHQKLGAGVRHPKMALRRLQGKSPADIDMPELARYVATEKAVVVEAGAFDGADTRRFALQWPKGHVHAFEPVPALMAKVRDRVADLENVSLYPEALSGDPHLEQVELHVGAPGQENASASILAPTEHLSVFPDVDLSSIVTAPAVTLDEWAAREGVDHVDLLWLDLQGAELQVLRQAEALLPRVRTAHLEVVTKPLYDGGATWDQVREFMTSRGFREVIARVPLLTGNVLYARG